MDLGTKNIGVAHCAKDTTLAFPLDPVLVDGTEFQKIRELIIKDDVKELIIGMPRNSDGSTTQESERVISVTAALKDHIGDLDIEIVFQDESLTSVEAENLKAQKPYLYKDHSLDSIAASIILMQYLEGANH